MNLSGDLRIYSAPKALLRHIEWSLNTIFEEHVSIEWINQPLSAGTFACEIHWRAKKARASKIASTLKSWHFIRFDVREFPTEGGEGVLYRCTPDLGLHQAVTASTGDIMIHENRLVSIMKSSSLSERTYERLQSALNEALGVAWDEELECYRRGLIVEAEPLRLSM